MSRFFVLLLLLISVDILDSKRLGNEVSHISYSDVGCNLSQKFKKCCARQKSADKECKHRFCDFDSINQNNVRDYYIFTNIYPSTHSFFQILFFLNTCKSRNETVRLMWDCASTRVDHTECCKQRYISSLFILHYAHSQESQSSVYSILCIE